MRTMHEWREIGESEAAQDWRDGNRGQETREDITSALGGHRDEDLSNADITEQTDESRALALASLVDGYVAEYRRLGGVVLA